MSKVIGRKGNLHINLDPKFQNLDAFVSNLVSTVQGTVREAMDSERKKMTTTIKKALRNQSFLLPPLTRSYLKRKIKEGHDKRIGIRTGAMLKAIKSYKDSKDRVFVGIRSSAKPKKRKKKGLSIVQYARIFEFGSKKQPPRPIFRPMFRQRKPEFVKDLRRKLKKSIKLMVAVWES